MVAKFLFHVALCVSGLIKVATAVPAISPATNERPARAIYFQTNEADNSIVALKVGENGTLSREFVTSTGGMGASSINSANNLTASPDGLSSQGSVTVVGSNLFAVNAGDNTVSIFAIDEHDPTRLVLLGAPALVPGDFPVSVTASERNQLVCAATSGSLGGVACAPYSPAGGIGEFDFLRHFDLDQAALPSSPLDTIAEIHFSQDETLLITTVKGDPAVNKTGYISAYSVTGGSPYNCARVSAADIRSEVNGTAVLFGFEQIPNTENYFVADATFGAAIIAVNESTQVSTLLHKTEIPGQRATCWSVVSSQTNSAFVTDPLVKHIVEMSLDDASILSITNLTTTNDATGFIDLVATGLYIYALAPGSENGTDAEVVVVSLANKKKTLVEAFNIGDWAGTSAQGMALYP